MAENRLRTGTSSIDEAGNNLAESLNAWLTKYGPSIIFKTCENCRHMSEGNAPAHCALYNLTPPARVILTGCPSHDDKEAIPF